MSRSYTGERIRGSREKQVEQPQADWVTLCVESVRTISMCLCVIASLYVLLLEVSNIRNPSLRVCNHLDEEIRKCRSAKLRILAPVQISVVNALFVCRVPQTGALVWCPAHRCASCLCPWSLVRLLTCVWLRSGSCDRFSLRLAWRW